MSVELTSILSKLDALMAELPHSEWRMAEEIRSELTKYIQTQHSQSDSMQDLKEQRDKAYELLSEALQIVRTLSSPTLNPIKQTPKEQ